jgi:hypothetical protein
MLYEDAELALGNTPAHTQHQVCIVYIQLLLYVKLITMENTCPTCNMEYDIDINFIEETNSYHTTKKCICDYMNMFYEHDSQMEKEYELPF